jgi:protein tyrosine phosphatase
MFRSLPRFPSLKRDDGSGPLALNAPFRSLDVQPPQPQAPHSQQPSLLPQQPLAPSPALSNLKLHYQRLLSTNGLEREFRRVDAAPVDRSRFTKSTPLVECKNRYSNIRTFDDTRVRLRDGPEGDYINASLVQVGAAQAFIVAQAPVDESVADFWCLVWESKVPFIAMLTPFEEHELRHGEAVLREKSAHYFPMHPQAEPMAASAYTVTCQRLEELENGLVVRHLRVCKQGERQPHDLLHAHYTLWPDFGCTDAAKPVLTLVALMEKTCSNGAGAPLVHCSAGIGRSGTFVAIAACVARARLGLPVSVPDVLGQLREHRMGMVQTLPQYKMIYETLLSS